MICDCCGKKKKLFESFAKVNGENNTLNFCSDCNDYAYKVRDAANEHNKSEYKKCLKAWNKRAKKCSVEFREWQKRFISANKP